MNFAAILVAASGSVALIQWGQILYRLKLFFVDYHGERGENHIADGDFTLIYVANALLLGAALFALRVLWDKGRRWRTAAGIIAVVNVSGWITLFAMHRTGVLVEYGEFIHHMRGEM